MNFRKYFKTNMLTRLQSSLRRFKVDARLFSLTSNNNQQFNESIYKNFRSLKEEKLTIQEFFPFVINEIVNEKIFEKNPEQKEWMRKLLDYNIVHGKNARTKSLIKSYKILNPNVTEEENFQLYILGSCFELCQGYILLEDDLMDQSLLRRGRPCWYKVDGVGLRAVNDASIIQGCIPLLLSRFLKKHKCYIEIMELFNKMHFNTSFGQNLDLYYQTNPNFNEKFKMDSFKAITKYKTSYYSIIAPLSAALYLAKINGREIHQKAENVLNKIGHFLQMQDDYIDCFANPELCGKDGTDIQNGKCTWLAVRAVELMNSKQKVSFQEYYGRPDDESITQIKNLYSELSLKKEYDKAAKQYMESIEADIEAFSLPELPKEILYNIFKINTYPEPIYKYI